MIPQKLYDYIWSTPRPASQEERLAFRYAQARELERLAAEAQRIAEELQACADEIRNAA